MSRGEKHMFNRAKFLISVGTMSLCLAASSAAAQQAARPAEKIRHVAHKSQDPWWKHAVIYEIYPRSFQDSNGDGVGDINGITSRLDYVRGPGIDDLWIRPMYPAPLVDFGYDISDYSSIDPLYGTLADFDRLVTEAKKRNIRVIMDFVPDNTD